MPVPFIFTPSAITVVLDGRTHVVPASSPNFNDLKVALRKNSDETSIKRILNIKAYVAQLSEGRADIVDGRLFFDGVPLAGVLADRVGQMFAEGFGVLPLLRFLNRVALNPRKDIAEELYPFLESGSLPITENGFVLAYKMVRSDFKDLYTGEMDNSPGSVPSMARYEDVDANRHNTCSQGLHFASLQYIESGAYGGNVNGNRLIMLEIDPADIVSIPTDYNRSKGRAWKYTVVRELEWSERIKELFVTNDYTSKNEDEDEDEDRADWDEDEDEDGDLCDEEEGDDWDEDEDEDEDEDLEPVKHKTPVSSKLDEEDVREILKLLVDPKNTLSAIAKMYDVSPRQIARIRDGEAWGWVEGAPWPRG